jgi:hypothetical protein
MMYINELSCLNLQGQTDASMSPEYAGEDGCWGIQENPSPSERWA